MDDGGARRAEVARLRVEASANATLADGNSVSPLTHADQRGLGAIVTTHERAGAQSKALCLNLIDGRCMENVTSRPFYGEYAWAYDLIIGRPVSHQCACITAFLVQRGVISGAKILDAGCGTGRYSLELARRGYMVTGLDASPQLIAEARRRASSSTLAVSFAVGDILALRSAPCYDGILCRGVLNDLLEERSRQEVFFAFARALRPAGVLIFDVREWHATVHRKQREPIFETCVDTARGQLTFRSVTQLDHLQRRLLIAEQHTLKKDDVETSSAYDFIMRCWTQEELHHHLTQAGFRAIAYFGDYDQTVPPGATDRLVGVASLT